MLFTTAGLRLGLCTLVTRLRRWSQTDNYLASPLCQSMIRSHPGSIEKVNQCKCLVEGHREGYPRFSALIAADGAFLICRRFLTLRVRLLLLKQDRLSMLEKKLNQIDNEETEELFVRSTRYDKNVERSAILSEINDALTDYGDARLLPLI